MTRDNDERCADAQAVIDSYIQRVGCEEYENEDLRTPLIDLLTDLRHWAADRGVDFDGAVETSEYHHSCESQETT